VDFSDKHLPQEANLPRALNFTKGCYIGQEIVERIRSRATVHRSLAAV
jgi:folate-binding protein YgfZ